MLINFANTSGKVYFNEYSTPYTNYVLKLKSRYSNEYLIFGGNNYLSLTIDENYDEWCSFTFTITEDITNKDIGGYYDVELYGNNGGSDVLLKTELAKVENNFTEGSTTSYVSDNDNNEQYVYYRK
jgi:hypothetical protein